MKAGQRIRVFMDPLTEQVLEDEARLVKRLPRDTDEGLEFWRVLFDGDNHTVERLVRTANLTDPAGCRHDPAQR